MGPQAFHDAQLKNGRKVLADVVGKYAELNTFNLTSQKCKALCHESPCIDVVQALSTVLFAREVHGGYRNGTR